MCKLHGEDRRESDVMGMMCPRYSYWHVGRIVCLWLVSLKGKALHPPPEGNFECLGSYMPSECVQCLLDVA